MMPILPTDAVYKLFTRGRKLSERSSEEISARVRRGIADAPFVVDLGMEFVDCEPGRVRARLLVTDRHLQMNGFVHAGVQATLADHCAGGCAITLAPPGHHVLTVEFKINLLRPATGDALLCEARILKPGKRFMVVESEVAMPGDPPRLASKATVTLAVLQDPGPGPGGQA